jgi:EAL domain-containing protein (putative c-di-GMP-specific phosphodiesterase class I)
MSAGALVAAAAARPAARDADERIHQILELMRAELDADVCFLCESHGGRAVVRTVVRARDREHAAARPFDPGIGAYLRAPVQLADGCDYGAVCCIRTESGSAWTERDEQFVALLARRIAHELEYERPCEAGATISFEEGLKMVFQPVFELDAGEVVAFEALARFPLHPHRSTPECFAAAAAAGEGVALELAAIRAALAQLDDLPEGVSLSLNASAEAVLTPEFADLVAPVADRVILELTEHEPVDDYTPVAEALAKLRERGAKLAIDDVGAGYASLRHILQLEPDIVKLDLSLTRKIESDVSRRALTTALVGFAEVVGATIAAEGIESEAELLLLRELGVAHGQGFHLGCPAPLEERLH